MTTNGSQYFAVPGEWLAGPLAAFPMATPTVPGMFGREVGVMGTAPDGAYLVVWHEVIAGFSSRKSMTVRPEWIGR